MSAREYKVPCGDTTGHGMYCCEGMLCSACTEVKRLRDAAAIAPPVAAGSVDTEELRKLALAATPGDQWRMNNDGGQFGLRVNSGYQGFFNHQRPNQKCTDEVFANVAYILAAKPSVVLSLIERAKKAEADLKQVNEWRAAALAESHALGELWAAKVEKSEAKSAHKQVIIDRLMLEYCPSEMTVEQMAEWASHQKRAE